MSTTSDDSVLRARVRRWLADPSTDPVLRGMFWTPEGLPICVRCRKGTRQLQSVGMYVPSGPDHLPLPAGMREVWYGMCPRCTRKAGTKGLASVSRRVEHLIRSAGNRN